MAAFLASGQSTGGQTLGSTVSVFVLYWACAPMDIANIPNAIGRSKFMIKVSFSIVRSGTSTLALFHFEVPVWNPQLQRRAII